MIKTIKIKENLKKIFTKILFHKNLFIKRRFIANFLKITKFIKKICKKKFLK